jgi:formate-dependent nitrite reductase membrane component NrfD
MTALDLLAQIAANPSSGTGLPPHWGWYIVLYFFLGGISAGSYFIGTLLVLMGDPRDRDTIRLGYSISFPLLIVCAILLIVDLGVPSRFWHMLFQSKDFPEVIFKWWAPMSLGSWILTLFGPFSLLAFLGVQVDSGRARWAPLVRFDRWARTLPRPLVLAWGAAGILFALAVAGYTGVLLTGTSIPFWHNARAMGALFLVSAASASYALLSLLLVRRGRPHSDPSVRKLERADRFTMILELILIAMTVILLGPVARPILDGGFGVAFWVGVVGLGLLLPLVIHRLRIAGWDEHRRTVLAAAFVLLGGLLLRYIIVMSPQYPEVPLWAL